MLAQLLVWKVQLPGGLLLMRGESTSCRYTMHALHNVVSDLVLSAHVMHSCAVSVLMLLPKVFMSASRAVWAVGTAGFCAAVTARWQVLTAERGA